jgi:hypothetical protein
MWRRLNREDLVGSNPLSGNHGEPYMPFQWRVYEEYEVLPATDGHGEPYIQAAKRPGHRAPVCVHTYNPLIDTPYLFLEFARIIDRKDPDRALMDWFYTYGLLGITRHNEQYGGPGSWKGMAFPQRYNDDKGGSWDHFEAIWALAYEANEALILYEAALGRDEQKLELALIPEDYPPEYAERIRRSLEEKVAATGSGWADILIDSALWQMLEFSMEKVHAYAYPDVTFPQQHQLEHDPDNAPLLRVGQLTRSWGARNLLGAMGLQFYWLITSASELAHCKHCNRIISYAPPMPGGDEGKARKPRRDKEFCSTQCRQNYHYHNRIKPGRQSRRI